MILVEVFCGGWFWIGEAQDTFSWFFDVLLVLILSSLSPFPFSFGVDKHGNTYTLNPSSELMDDATSLRKLK